MITVGSGCVHDELRFVKVDNIWGICNWDNIGAAAVSIGVCCATVDNYAIRKP